MVFIGFLWPPQLVPPSLLFLVLIPFRVSNGFDDRHIPSFSFTLLSSNERFRRRRRRASKRNFPQEEDVRQRGNSKQFETLLTHQPVNIVPNDHDHTEHDDPKRRFGLSGLEFFPRLAANHLRRRDRHPVHQSLQRTEGRSLPFPTRRRKRTSISIDARPSGFRQCRRQRRLGRTTE